MKRRVSLIGMGIAALIAGLARQSRRSVERGESPLEIVWRHRASKEIEREEFERMKEMLTT